MKLAPLDLAIILGYILLTFLIGFYISKKASGGLKSYFLGDNSIKWWMLGFSNSSGMFDVSGSAWMVSMVFIYGINIYWQQWAWPVWNQVFLMMFLSVWLRRSGVMTGAEWISFRFGKDKGAQASHLITVIFAVFVAIAFIVYMSIGIGKFAATILPWNVAIDAGPFLISQEKVYSIIIILLTTVYSVKGGMYSVVATEILQYILVIICCICVAFLAMTLVSKDSINAFFPHGWKTLSLQSQVNLDWNRKWPAVNKVIDDSGFRDFGLVFSVMAFKGVWSSLAGPVPSYDMQRILSTKSPREAAKMNAFTMVVLYFPLYLLVGGILALSIYYFNIGQMSAEGKPNLEALLGMVITQLPTGVKGLIMAGMLAAFMSTFSAVVNSGPAYIVNDIYKKYINPTASQKTYVRISYISCASIVLLGLLIGLGVQNISTMFNLITGGLYAGFVVPNVLKWIWGRFNGWGYFASMVAGIIVSLLSILFWKSGHIVLSFPINMGIALATAIIVSYATEKQDAQTVRHFYTRTRPWGFWRSVKKEVMHTDASFRPNKNFGLDTFNVFIGIIWQMTMIITPIFLVLKEFRMVATWSVVWLVCSVILYFSWYKKLPVENDV